jgi:P-type E1-E2 ATPase
MTATARIDEDPRREKTVAVGISVLLHLLVIGGIAWAVSGDPVRFAEVLVVATPCPLLIAAPVAFIAGMSRAAGFGVIIKNGGVLERLARVRTAAFDKTGTLTRGEPVVTRVDTIAGLESARVLSAAASVEQDSAHVLANAVVTAAGTGAAAARETTSNR